MLCKLGISSSSVEVPSLLVFGNAQGDGTISASSLPLLVLRFCLFLVLRFRNLIVSQLCPWLFYQNLIFISDRELNPKHVHYHMISHDHKIRWMGKGDGVTRLLDWSWETEYRGRALLLILLFGLINCEEVEDADCLVTRKTGDHLTVRRCSQADNAVFVF